MAAIRFLLCIFCIVGFGRCWGAERNSIADGVLAIAKSQLHVREKTGKNDGVEVEAYLTYVGFKRGNPWCAAYVSWVFFKAGYPLPRTAWSPALFPAAKVVKEPKPGWVFGIYFPDLKRIGHCGLVEKLQGDFVMTLEGNTNLEGSREGQGVYRRLRHKRTINKYANWF
ncbi:MAG: CHAP domain-containing protein [Pedobacter sp.]|nr:MAG: CHAP domain-containing protein [Pedobacter sp.]